MVVLAEGHQHAHPDDGPMAEQAAAHEQRPQRGMSLVWQVDLVMVILGTMRLVADHIDLQHCRRPKLLVLE